MCVSYAWGTHLQYILALAAVYSAAIEIALCADQEPVSSLPIRGTHQEKIKAARSEASSHYSLSVNSTQAWDGQMRVEFEWRRFWRRTAGGGVERNHCGPKGDPDQKEKMTCQPEEGSVCFLSVFVHGCTTVQATQIDLDITEVVHVQGHWIIIPVRRQHPASIYQGRQLFNMKCNESKLKCQEDREMTPT